MANVKLGEVSLISSMLRSNSLLVEVGGSVKRIKGDDFMSSMDTNSEQSLRQVAWGIPLRENQSSPAWGMVGNTALYADYAARCGRWLVKNDGTAAKLNAAGSGIYADGTALDESKGHVMWIAPALYCKVQADSMLGCTVLWMSSVPIGGFRLSTTRDGQWLALGAYIGSMSGTALTSRSGLTPANAKSITYFWNSAQVNGAEWGLMDYTLYLATAYLSLCESGGNANVQATLGYGVCGSTNTNNALQTTANTLLTGATKSLGDSTGNIPITLTDGTYTTSNSSRVNILGIEDLYGWLYTTIQGIYGSNSANSAQTGTEIYIYEGNRLPSAAELITHPEGQYRTQTKSLQGGYVTAMQLGDYGDFIAKTHGGASYSYYCDAQSSSLAGELCQIGGRVDANVQGGPFHNNFVNSFASSPNGASSRLAYYGNLTFTDGRNIT